MATTNQSPEYFTLQQIAERWGVSHSTVLSHVYGGELRAVDISTNPKGKSRYIVPAAALAEFEAARTTPPPEKPATSRKRGRIPAGAVIEFFK